MKKQTASGPQAAKIREVLDNPKSDRDYLLFPAFIEVADDSVGLAWLKCMAEMLSAADADRLAGTKALYEFGDLMLAIVEATQECSRKADRAIRKKLGFVFPGDERKASR